MKPSSWYPRPGFSEDLGHEEGSKRWVASSLVLVVRGESHGLDSSFRLEKRKSCLDSCRPDVDFGLRRSCRG